jgi:hypothetical protein
MDNRMKKTTGFILIELVSTIVLVGIIGVFTSFFIYSAVNSFIYTKEANEGALKAQIALDRISLELRGINGISDYSDDTHIEYTNDDLPDTRKIRFDSASGNILIKAGVPENILLDNVATFNMSLVGADLNNSGDGNNEIAGINVSFTLSGIGRSFNMRIYPRHMLPVPP